MAAYGLGSTRWQAIYRVVIPAAKPGILSGVILGLARAFGEALAVAKMCIRDRYLTKPQPDELVRFGWDPESDLWTQDLARGYEAVCLRQATAGKEQQ